jgi:hypothetical protein
VLGIGPDNRFRILFHNPYSGGRVEGIDLFGKKFFSPRVNYDIDTPHGFRMFGFQ